MNLDLDRLTDEVLRRLEKERPKALLIGRPPREDGGFLYVQNEPYSAVVIGVLSPEKLLQMPTDPVCVALMEGLPVWLWPQSYEKGKRAILLRRELMAAEQRLVRFGVKPVPVGSWWKERQNDRRYGNG